MANKSNAFVTSQGGDLSTKVRNHPGVFSYSGADYKFLVHVPVESKSYLDIAFDEIQDEIHEVENWIRILKLRKSRTIGASLVLSIENSITSYEQLISRLKAEQQRLKKEKVDIVPRVLDSLQTLSFQIHTDKQPVRALGHSYPKGYTRGARLVAGSMIFTVLDEHPLIKVIDAYNSGNRYDVNKFSSGQEHSYDMFPSSAVIDQLPPMHLTILGVNESGSAVNITLYGVEFINDGMVMSIQDLLTEDTASFVAQDIDIMRTLDTRGVLKIPAVSRAVTASSFLSNPVAMARRARRGFPF